MNSFHLREAGETCSKHRVARLMREANPIAYRNVHGPFNTGLPDYFCLVILSEATSEASRWGLPYRDVWVVDRIPLDELEERMKNSRYA